MLDFHHRVNCGGVPRPSQQRCSSVLERVGQLAIGGDDGDVQAYSCLFQRTSVACNNLTLFGCTMVLLMTTGESRVQCQTHFVAYFVIFESSGFSPGKN